MVTTNILEIAMTLSYKFAFKTAASAAVNTGKDCRLLDHLAPLCAQLKMPLYLTEEKNHELCQKYYPVVDSLYVPTSSFSLFSLAQKYEVLFQSTFWERELKALLKSLYPHVRFAYCPHGNSDKGYQKPMLAPILWQDLVLLYGEHMQERLKKQNLWEKLPPFLFTGNYRLSYYLEHQKFYDELAEREIFSKLDSQYPTLLYAPTWNDEENATSFFTSIRPLIAQLPSHYNLIVKVHPLLEEMDPVSYYRALPELGEKGNVLLLNEFPPIFPLLARTDIYIGDASSIGYDFLYFQKPMFFFPSMTLPLHACGVVIPETESNLFEFIERHLFDFDEKKKSQQKKMWDFAFGDC